MKKMEFVSKLTSTGLKETIVFKLTEILFDGRYDGYDLTEGCKRLIQIARSGRCDHDDLRSLLETIPNIIRADDRRELLERDCFSAGTLIDTIFAQPHNNKPKRKTMAEAQKGSIDNFMKAMLESALPPTPLFMTTPREGGVSRFEEMIGKPSWCGTRNPHHLRGEAMDLHLFNRMLHPSELRSVWENTHILSDYEFQVNEYKAINFRKIMDDLDYSNPFAVVRFDNEIYAVVHHTIQDKIQRADGMKLNTHQAIIDGVAKIDNNEINRIKDYIKAIKKARWTDRNLEKPVNVTVTNITC